MIFIRRMLVLGWRPGRLVLYWYPVYADERQRQTNRSAPCRAIRRPLMRARRCELKPRAGRRTVRGARRGAYPKTPRQNTVIIEQQVMTISLHLFPFGLGLWCNACIVVFIHTSREWRLMCYIQDTSVLQLLYWGSSDQVKWLTCKSTAELAIYEGW